MPSYTSVLPGSTRLPKVSFEFGPFYTPASTPFAFGSGTSWVDVTSSVREFQWGYGRNDELGDYQPGSGYIVLDNRDRRFDPTNTAGTFYGNLKPRRTFHFTAVDSGGTYLTDYFMWAVGFPQAWPSGGADNVTRVDLVDQLSISETIKFPIGYTRPLETIADRWTAVLGDAGFSQFSIPICGTYVAALEVTDTDQSVFRHLRDLARTDGGVLAQRAGGFINYESKRLVITSGAASSNRLNFTDSRTAGGTYIHYSPTVETVQDDNYLWNSATVSGAADGVLGYSSDDASQTEFNQLNQSLSTLYEYETDCEDRAQYLTYLYAQPKMRAPTLQVDLATCAASAQALLIAAGPDFPCRVTRFATAAVPLTLDLKVESIRHMISPGQYLMQFGTSPADLSSYWTIETSTLGTIDSTNLIAP